MVGFHNRYRNPNCSDEVHILAGFINYRIRIGHKQSSFSSQETRFRLGTVSSVFLLHRILSNSPSKPLNSSSGQAAESPALLTSWTPTRLTRPQATPHLLSFPPRVDCNRRRDEGHGDDRRRADSLPRRRPRRIRKPDRPHPPSISICTLLAGWPVSLNLVMNPREVGKIWNLGRSEPAL